jgi:Holliday junction resolvase RusA-like endonuclease
MKIEFTIPGNPVAKGRARTYRRGNYTGHFTPKKTKCYESLVAEIGREAMKGQIPTTNPVKMGLIIYMPIPKSWPNKQKTHAMQGIARPAKTPDIDNIFKSVADGLNGIVYADDSQIVEISAQKWYSLEPRCVVKIEEI